MIRYSKVCLDTFGYVLPPRVLTSEEIEQRLTPLYARLKLPQGRLELMSGIKERRLWPFGTRPSEAAIHAGKDVLRRSGVSAREIQSLIFTSVSRDMMEPATASFVHHGLGLSDSCFLFDISNACLGFLDGVVTLANMIELGQVENGLVLSGETAETLLESTIKTLAEDQTLSRKTIKPAFASLTIGSGCVGLFMRRCKSEEKRPRLSHGAWMTNTRQSHLCLGNCQQNGATLMETDSEKLLLEGVRTAAKTWDVFSRRSGWSSEEIDRFFCHQVGSAHARKLFETLHIDEAKNYQTLAEFGNVGSVSAPLTMALGIDNEVFVPGERAALLGIGSGINCLMLGIEWDH